MPTRQRRRHRLILPGDPAAAQAARHHLASVCRDLSADSLDAALLLTTELVTSTLLDEVSEVEVVLSWPGAVLRVEVRGRAEATGVLPGNPPTGWAQLLVERLANRWGVGEAVWFELDLPGAAPA